MKILLTVFVIAQIALIFYYLYETAKKKEAANIGNLVRYYSRFVLSKKERLELSKKPTEKDYLEMIESLRKLAKRQQVRMNGLRREFAATLIENEQLKEENIFQKETIAFNNAKIESLQTEYFEILGQLHKE